MDSENENKPGIQSAFTLIERLVVLATTAILAAMPLPALSKAKQKAKAIQCVSNLKQMGLGLILFADDNQDCLPGPLLAGQGSAYNNHSLHQLTYSLARYIGGKFEPVGCRGNRLYSGYVLPRLWDVFQTVLLCFKLSN